MATILVIEDEQILSETLGYNLERAGFTVELAADGIIGLEQARRLQPDLIILDIMLPGLDGFSVCRTIARESAVPIIILTALQDEAHRIAGLELGAIDYVIKPFSMGELLARVRAILRWNERQRQMPGPDVLQAGPLRLDRVSRQVWQGEREIELSYKEFDLLACRTIPVWHSHATCCWSGCGAASFPARTARSTYTSAGCARSLSTIRPTQC